MSTRGLLGAVTLARALPAGPSRLACAPRAAAAAGSAVWPMSPSTPAAAARLLTTSAAVASGHSRWSKIRHKKGAADSARGQFFSRLMAGVHSALRPPNSPDPTLNPRLADALQKAKDGGVPKSVVESAFVRAKKLADGSGKAVTFEAIGASGTVAFMIEAVTDNGTRTVNKVKEILSKKGLGRLSSVAFMFDRKGRITVQPVEGNTDASFDGLFEVAVEGGAEDVQEVDGEVEGEKVWEIITAPNDLGALTQLLSSPPHDAAYVINESELAYIAIDPVSTDDLIPERVEGVERIIEMLEDDTDVVKVWTNMVYPEVQAEEPAAEE